MTAGSGSPPGHMALQWSHSSHPGAVDRSPESGIAPRNWAIARAVGWQGWGRAGPSGPGLAGSAGRRSRCAQRSRRPVSCGYTGGRAGRGHRERAYGPGPGGAERYCQLPGFIFQPARRSGRRTWPRYPATGAQYPAVSVHFEDDVVDHEIPPRRPSSCAEGNPDGSPAPGGRG